jgi:hypothetical protein
MTGAFGILFLWLLSKMGKRATGYVDNEKPPTTSPTAAAAAAATAANAAATNPTPSNLQHAATTAQHAAAMATQAAKASTAAAKQPSPWPQAKPEGLPPFPSGWEADNPPPPAVVTRAWQLLPILWKRGRGATAVETIKGRWITFQAQIHAGNKKGVTAYRVKAGHGATGNW